LCLPFFFTIYILIRIITAARLPIGAIIMLLQANDFLKILLLIVMGVHLTGCSSDGDIQPYKNSKTEQNISFATGKPQGTDIFELGQENTGSGSMPVNALLWRAALDIASFVPLDDVDTFGGSIVTEWYVPKDQTNQRLKLAVFVVGLELRSDAIQVRAYVQNRDGDGWTNAGRDPKLGRKLEDLILTRARELRAAAISETSN
jgi:hypothetical protein